MGDSSRLLIEAIDSEIVEVKGTVNYHRSVLLVSLGLMSALFWDLFMNLPQNGLTMDHIVQLIVYILPVLYLFAASELVWAIYRARSEGNNPRYSGEFDVEFLPHIVLFLCLMLIGWVSSAVNLWLAFENSSDYSTMDRLSYAGSLVFFSVIIIFLSAGSKRIRRWTENANRQLKSVQKENDGGWLRQGGLGWKSFEVIAAVMLLIGIHFLLVAWRLNDNIAYIEVAIKGTLLLVAIMYCLERVGKISDGIAVLDDMKSRRRAVWVGIVKDDAPCLETLTHILASARSIERSYENVGTNESDKKTRVANPESRTKKNAKRN